MNSVVGASVPRKEGLGKVSGQAVYVDDLQFPNLLYGAKFTVDGESLHHRHKLTPYIGRKLCGVVKRTYLRGRLVSSQDQPFGRVLKRACA